MSIVAIVGMCGSGKSIASDYFESLGYKKVYFGGVTMDKLKEANLDVTPSNERMMRESLRKQYGMGAFALLLLPRIDELVKHDNVVLDGLYSWDELKILRDKYGDALSVIGVVVDRCVRYERLMSRDVRPLTRDEAVSRDLSEIENIAKAGPIAFADFYVDNNGSVLEYKKRLDVIKSIIEKE